MVTSEGTEGVKVGICMAIRCVDMYRGWVMCEWTRAVCSYEIDVITMPTYSAARAARLRPAGEAGTALGASRVMHLEPRWCLLFGLRCVLCVVLELADEWSSKKK